jgi:hypothetical protein
MVFVIYNVGVSWILLIFFCAVDMFFSFVFVLLHCFFSLAHVYVSGIDLFVCLLVYVVYVLFSVEVCRFRFRMKVRPIYIYIYISLFFIFFWNIFLLEQLYIIYVFIYHFTNILKNFCFKTIEIENGFFASNVNK